MPLSREQLRGREFDWFAVDRRGFIGHFSTAGYGKIPEAILAAYDLVSDLSERILLLSTIASAEGHLAGKIDDWLEMARRGLFSYDWKHWKGPYRRAATPSAPIVLKDLPVELAIVQTIRFDSVCFDETSELNPETLCACA